MALVSLAVSLSSSPLWGSFTLSPPSSNLLLATCPFSARKWPSVLFYWGQWADSWKDPALLPLLVTGCTFSQSMPPSSSSYVSPSLCLQAACLPFCSLASIQAAPGEVYLLTPQRLFTLRFLWPCGVLTLLSSTCKQLPQFLWNPLSFGFSPTLGSHKFKVAIFPKERENM